jgi:predicted anti-sigma-YlaC factor YlaD
VDCDDFREALSARLDNEENADDAQHPADAHLEYCADCAFWYDAAALITRRTRTTVAVAWPDVADAVLARVPPGRGLPRVRFALGAVAVVQCGAGVATLTGLSGLGYETGAWQLALGVAFGTVAARRTPTASLVPLLGTLVAVLALGQFAGLTVTGAVSCLLAAVGLGLVVLLGRMPPVHREPTPPKPAANHLRHDEKLADNGGDVRHPTIWTTKSTKSA